MRPQQPTYVLGSGAIGFPLAAHLARAGRPVVAVRTSRGDVSERTVTVAIDDGERCHSVSVRSVSLSRLERLDGTVVVTTKAYANGEVARAIRAKGATGPVVVMQNGLGVEKPFVELGLRPVYRCVIYATGQSVSEYGYTFRPVAPSPVGVVEGDGGGLEACVARLSTDAFPFRVEADIRRAVWKKTIINAVFNSVCPLLDVDNGVFVRDANAADLARAVVRECLAVADRLGVGLREGELMGQLMLISEKSEGQHISTLQDLRAGRPTEIGSLNLEIARVAASLKPSIDVPRTELLGRMIMVKALQGEWPAP